MKLKLDANGNPVLQDGKPVYVMPDGKEIAFDFAENASRISRLNAEAQSHRERAEAAEKSLQAFSGITDPAAALKAMQTVAGLDEKKLIQAGERDAAVKAAVKPLEDQLSAITRERDEARGQLDSHLVRGAFAGSKFIAEKFSAKGPAGVDIAQALFASRFKVENGKLVAYGTDGNKLYSPTRHGELADADEAIALMVDAYPHKASILAGTGQSGTGAGGSGAGAGGKPTYTRAQFAALSPVDQAKAAKEGVVVD